MKSIDLIKSNEIVDKLSKLSLEDYNSVTCWVNKESDYNMYIFTVHLNNESELIKIWRNITGEIASNFQSQLEKDIEIWNLYIVFFVEESVSKESKYLIEQNKYSSRKLVLDGVNLNDEKDDLRDILVKKLLQLEIKDGLNKDIIESKSLENENFYTIIMNENPILSALILNGSQNIYEDYLEALYERED